MQQHTSMRAAADALAADAARKARIAAAQARAKAAQLRRAKRKVRITGLVPCAPYLGWAPACTYVPVRSQHVPKAHSEHRQEREAVQSAGLRVVAPNLARVHKL